jgi:hypothetical protein
MEVTANRWLLAVWLRFVHGSAKQASGINVPGNPPAALFGDLWQGRLSDSISAKNITKSIF